MKVNKESCIADHGIVTSVSNVVQCNNEEEILVIDSFDDEEDDQIALCSLPIINSNMKNRKYNQIEQNNSENRNKASLLASSLDCETHGTVIMPILNTDEFPTRSPNCELNEIEPQNSSVLKNTDLFMQSLFDNISSDKQQNQQKSSSLHGNNDDIIISIRSQNNYIQESDFKDLKILTENSVTSILNSPIKLPHNSEVNDKHKSMGANDSNLFMKSLFGQICLDECLDVGETQSLKNQNTTSYNDKLENDISKESQNDLRLDEKIKLKSGFSNSKIMLEVDQSHRNDHSSCRIKCKSFVKKRSFEEREAGLVKNENNVASNVINNQKSLEENLDQIKRLRLCEIKQIIHEKNIDLELLNTDVNVQSIDLDNPAIVNKERVKESHSFALMKNKSNEEISIDFEEIKNENRKSASQEEYQDKNNIQISLEQEKWVKHNVASIDKELIHLKGNETLNMPSGKAEGINQSAKNSIPIIASKSQFNNEFKTKTVSSNFLPNISSITISHQSVFSKEKEKNICNNTEEDVCITSKNKSLSRLTNDKDKLPCFKLTINKIVDLQEKNIGEHILNQHTEAGTFQTISDEVDDFFSQSNCTRTENAQVLNGSSCDIEDNMSIVRTNIQLLQMADSVQEVEPQILSYNKVPQMTDILSTHLKKIEIEKEGHKWCSKNNETIKDSTSSIFPYIPVCNSSSGEKGGRDFSLNLCEDNSKVKNIFPDTIETIFMSDNATKEIEVEKSFVLEHCEEISHKESYSCSEEIHMPFLNNGCDKPSAVLKRAEEGQNDIHLSSSGNTALISQSNLCKFVIASSLQAGQSLVR